MAAYGFVVQQRWVEKSKGSVGKTNQISQAAKQGRPRIGIGANTQIRHAIIDKNARIGKHCRISPDDKPQEMDHALYHIRDGIVIIPKNAVVPDGTVI